MEPSNYAERPDVLAYRVRETQDDVKELKGWRREVDDERAITKEQHKYMRDDIKHLTSGFDGLRKTLLTFSFTIAASAIIFALSILISTGKLR